MLRVGLIGLGFMGRAHLGNYRRLEEDGEKVKLVAVCDVEPQRLEGRDTISGNIGKGNSVDLTQYARYADYNKMLAAEKLDYVDIALPTYLHAAAAIAAMMAGCHVLSEKPMARTVAQCEEMIAVSRGTGKKLMIAQCLRFWPAYEYLKGCVESGRFGQVVSAYFFRGGGTPKWSWQGWLMDSEKSGGCLLDQHVHDVDMVNWLFGPPDSVTANGINIVPGSGFDAVSARYIYNDGMVVCAEDDWTLNGGYGFDMQYRVNFTKGSVHFSHGRVMAYPAEGEGYEPGLPADDGYYREIRYFINCVTNDKPIETCTPESTRDTIAIATAEQASAEKSGAIIKL
jgi:predicted dehydrogenase